MPTHDPLNGPFKNFLAQYFEGVDPTSVETINIKVPPELIAGYAIEDLMEEFHLKNIGTDKEVTEKLFIELTNAFYSSLGLKLVTKEGPSMLYAPKEAQSGTGVHVSHQLTGVGVDPTEGEQLSVTVTNYDF